MCAAGEYKASLFFLCTQARPVDVVSDVATDEGADAGAAGAVSAGALGVDLGSLGGLQDGLVGICDKLLAFWLDIRQ